MPTENTAASETSKDVASADKGKDKKTANAADPGTSKSVASADEAKDSKTAQGTSNWIVQYKET